MIIGLFIFSILIFISPFIISKLFKLKSDQGYLFGLLSSVTSIGFGVCLGIVFSIIFLILGIVFRFDISLDPLIAIICILILVGIFICIYYFHLKFIKKIKDENINAVIFMYLSGYFFVTAIIAFFFSFDVTKFDEMLNLIMNFLPHYIFFMNFGICICIFFYLKQNNEILYYISIGTHSGQLITLIILIIAIIRRILDSMIMMVILAAIAILFSLFSLIIGIYVYIKYRQADNLESVKELGDTTDGNLV